MSTGTKTGCSNCKMLVPGSNLLQLALGVIGQQAVEWRRYAGQETLANGAVRTRWGNPTTIYGSLQPADSRLLQQLGLDWTKNYVVFRGSAAFTDVDRDQTGDKLSYGGKTYQIVGKTDWYLQDGWQAVVAVELPTERNVVAVIRPSRIASTSRVPSPRVSTVAPTGQTVRPTLITSTARVPAPRVRPGAVGLRPALIASTAMVPEPMVTPGAVGVQPTVIPSTARVPEPQVVPGAVGVRPERIASTSRVPEPTVAVESAWYDAPEFDMWKYVHDANGRRAAAWTGEPKVGGRWPKAEAPVSDVTSVIAPAGRGYMAVPGGPYQYDTAANTPRYDAYRGRPQLVIEPLPRFNRLFPSASITAPLTLPMIEYDYIVGLRYGGLRFDGASVGTTGTYTIEAVEPGVWTWGVMPHSALGDVTITPLGEARDVQMDTRTVTGRTPGYPTIPVQTTTERVDQAAEIVQPSAAIVAQLALQGTLLVQGQFYAPPAPGQSRVVLGWDYNGVIAIDSAGNATCTANGGNLSVPSGGAGGDPFRVVVSFRERDEAGGFPADRPGITRLSANGSTVAEYEARYGAGLGEHVNMFLARRQNVEDDCGGGAYDLLCYTDELLPAADVQAASAYPDRVPGASPTRAVEPAPRANNPRLAILGPSTAQRNAIAQPNTPNNYGYGPCGPYMWAMRTGLKWDHRLQYTNTSSPPYFTGDNFGQENAGFPEIIAQCDRAVSAFSAITNKWVSLAPGRNEIQNGTVTREQYLANVQTCVDKLVAGGFTQGTNKIVLEGVWKKSTNHASWAAGSPARLLSDQVNEDMAAYAATVPGVVFLDMQTGLQDPNGQNGNPYPDTTVSDWTHYSQTGAQRAGKIIRDALEPLLVSYPYPPRPASNRYPAMTGTTGTRANGATGTVFTGYEVAREASGNVATVTASIQGSAQRITVTNMGGVSALTEAAHFRLASNGTVPHQQPAGTLIGQRVRVQIPATGAPFSLAVRLTDTGTGGRQGMATATPFGTGTSTSVTQAAPITSAQQPVLYCNGDEDLDLWLETPLVPAVSGGGLRPAVILRYGPSAATLVMDIVDIQSFVQGA